MTLTHDENAGKPAPRSVSAALIKRADNGPIFFRQMRLGRGRQPFAILKLRTMRDGTEITRPGRWLRRTGLDEIAQFLNVLKGDTRVVAFHTAPPSFSSPCRGGVPQPESR